MKRVDIAVAGEVRGHRAVAEVGVVGQQMSGIGKPAAAVRDEQHVALAGEGVDALGAGVVDEDVGDSVAVDIAGDEVAHDGAADRPRQQRGAEFHEGAVAPPQHDEGARFLGAVVRPSGVVEITTSCRPSPVMSTATERSHSTCPSPQSVPSGLDRKIGSPKRIRDGSGMSAGKSRGSIGNPGGSAGSSGGSTGSSGGGSSGEGGGSSLPPAPLPKVSLSPAPSRLSAPVARSSTSTDPDRTDTVVTPVAASCVTSSSVPRTPMPADGVMIWCSPSLPGARKKFRTPSRRRWIAPAPSPPVGASIR
jgi:uncharacterized membrane protein YgcG